MTGIYKITNTESGLVYIGSSTDIEKRFSIHWGALNAGNHHSYKLQNAFNRLKNKFALKFEILEECSKESLLQRENDWMIKYDSINNGYNVVSSLEEDIQDKLVPSAQSTIKIRPNQIDLIDKEKFNYPYRGRFALSGGWFSDYKNIDEQRALMLCLNNLCRNIYKNSGFAWTTHAAYRQLLSSNGTTKRFVKMESDQSHDSTVVAFVANIFLPTCNRKPMFLDCETTDDTYALHKLLRWLWLSPISSGGKIELYLPSKRMRDLLTGWIKETTA